MLRAFLLFLLVIIVPGCANIVPPSGGERDTTPPKLVRVTPADSLLSVRTTKIELRFDEYITVNDPTAIQISPLMSVPLQVTPGLKTVTITIPDTLLKESTTYTITFAKAIQDLHEGNVFSGYTYRFSTGAYFDSLLLQGTVINAATGMPDTGSRILLYEDSPRGDSVVVSGPPLYTTTTDGAGNYRLQGLPGRAFRIYAHRETNGNLTYDAEDESIAFLPRTVTPSVADSALPALYLFRAAAGDSVVAVGKKSGKGFAPRDRDEGPSPSRSTGYTVLADTSANVRSQELTKHLPILFTAGVKTYTASRVFLTMDSAGITTEVPFRLTLDSVLRRQLLLSVAWQGDRSYTLRLQKGFATDSTGNDFLPGKYTFRTRREEDYATLKIDVPPAYRGAGFVLQVQAPTGVDPLYKSAVTSPAVTVRRATPGTYNAIIIQDDNRNGKWDPGNLMAGLQPERVITHAEAINLKPGWEVQVDFKPGNIKRAGKNR